MSRFFGLYAAWTLLLAFIFAAPYTLLLCRLPMNASEWVVAAIEALNYSVQTVTTVGYGNWSPADSPCDKHEKFQIPLTSVTLSGLQGMKAVSVVFMAVGAVFFGITVGFAVEWIKSVSP